MERALAEKHYAVHKGKFFYDDLVKTISASPVVAAVLEGPNAIAVVRAMVGATRPHEAAPGTIRGDYALVGLRNLVHASDAPETAAAEITLWFPEGAELLEGVIDLVFEEDDAWVLVDYKSDAVTPQNRAALVAFYTPQVAIYRRYWEQLTGKATRAGLFFIASGEPVWLASPAETHASM